ncbi:MAG: carboxypeptidase-like regulatory domain-containing protein, partial [Alphaproteobacteria bacterium]|nr:carboxypeptidase-like regulatory domain-containing protein [Alphaproteobacteria bacterium]
MSEFRKCEIDVSSEIFRMWSFDKDKVPEKYKQMVEAYLNEAVTVASKGTCVPGGPFQCNVGDIRKDCSPCARISGEQRAQTQHQKDAIQEKCGGKQGAPGGAAAVIKDSSSYSGDNSGSAATSRREVRLAANAERQQAIKEATASSSSNNFSSCEEVKQQYDIEELGNAALRGYCACGWITKLSCNPNIVTCQNIPGIANKSKDAAFTTALTEYCKNPTGSSPVKADAQIRAITGTVKDADGKGLAGVSVIVTGTSIGTATDISGNFSLNVTNSNQKRLEFGYP